MAYSVESSEVSTVVLRARENVLGVIHHAMQDKIYWSGSSESEGKIYRGNKDGSQMETLLTSAECKLHYFT